MREYNRTELVRLWEQYKMVYPIYFEPKKRNVAEKQFKEIIAKNFCKINNTSTQSLSMIYVMKLHMALSSQTSEN